MSRIEQEQLSLIYEMIERAKFDIRQSSVFYLIWGWSILLASLSNFALLQFPSGGWAYFPWLVFSLLASGLTLWFARKKEEGAGSSSYVVRVLGYFWISFSICLLLVVLAGVLGFMDRTAIFPLCIILYGMGAFVSGAMLRFRPLMAAGIACWGLALIAFVVPFAYQLLLIALAITLAWLVPGYLLKRMKAPKRL